MAIKLPRIEMSSANKKRLATKHKTTTQSVRNALRYITNSEEAKAIRKSAKEILIEDAKKISIEIG